MVIAKTREELLEGAKKFVVDWKKLGMKSPYEAIEQWETMMFQIIRGGPIEMLHSIKEELMKMKWD